MLRYILYGILVFIIIRWIGKIFFPSAKANPQKQYDYPPKQNRYDQNKGSASSSGSKKKSEDNLGEYVDYEEVD